MSGIDDLRNRMDQVTLDLVKLLKRRTDIAGEIGRVKKTIGKGVTDEARENSLRDKVVSLSKEVGLDEGLAVRFLNFLLNESVRVQSGSRQTHLSVFLKAKELERQGGKIVHMEVGEPDFMPPRIVRTAMQESFDRGFVRYGQAAGRVEFRKALAEKASKDYSIQADEENILVTPGARFSVFLAITTLLNPGDEIVIIEPAWPAYRDCALNAGVKVRSVKTTLENRWEPKIEEIEGLVDSNTRMIVLNYPNNPTGKILPAALQDEIVELAKRNDLYVLSDEIYAQYARVPSKSILEYGYDKSIVAQSFSKSHAMTGFRVGYSVAEKSIVERMSRLQALSLTSVSEPMQYAAMAALDQDTSENTATINSRLAVLSEKAREANLEFLEPDGAMYIFAKASQESFDGVEFSHKALEEGLAVAPGDGFGDYKEFIRISACRDEKTLKEGMDILSEVLRR